MSMMQPDFDDINAVLTEAGVISKKSTSDVKTQFEEKGAGISDAAQQIANLMKFADNEAVKLQAAKLALQVQGVFDDPEVSKAPVINISIVSSGESRNLVQLLTPVSR